MDRRKEMKKIAHLLLVLTLIGFSACGKKKNKTDENAVANQFCDAYGNCYDNTYNGNNAYSSGAGSVLSRLSSNQYGGFQSLSQPLNLHFEDGVFSIEESSWWIFDTTSREYDKTSDFTVFANLNGSCSGNRYGNSVSEVVSRLVSEVNNSGGAIMQLANNVYKVRESDGDVITLDFNQTTCANPVWIESPNGNVTFYRGATVGF